MLDQEAAFLQIREAKTMVEEDLQKKLEEFEGEREQLQKVADAAASLEQQLEQASNYCFLNPRLTEIYLDMGFAQYACSSAIHVWLVCDLWHQAVLVV